MATPELNPKAVDAVTGAIATSFAQDKARQTQNEIRARFNHCRDLVAIMRGDLGWSWTRISDTLPHALRCKLDGDDWVPPSRNSWVPSPRSGLLLPPGLS